MTQEELKYTIRFNPINGMYYSDVKRNFDGEWNSMHVTSHLTQWGAKLHTKRYIRKWAKGKFRSKTGEYTVVVNRRW